jgi:hypothetical protein
MIGRRKSPPGTVQASMPRAARGGAGVEKMAKRVFSALVVGLVLTAGLAWALSEADIGGVWIQATFNQRIQVANILSREFKIDPGKLLECLEKVFADPANGNMTIRDAAQKCKAQQ